MTAAWVTVGLLVLGVPLLAWWVGGRRFWGRLRPGAEADPWRDAVRRHRLSAAEAARLAREVPRGSTFDDPRLRRAAVDWAETLLAQESPRPRTRRGRVLAALFVAWATCVIAYLVNRVLVGRPEDVNWVSVVAFSLFAVYAVRRRRGLRRTIALNSEQAVGK